MPPSIAIATPVLGGPGTMRVVLNSSSTEKCVRVVLNSSSTEKAPVLGGPESVRVVLSSSSSSTEKEVAQVGD